MELESSFQPLWRRVTFIGLVAGFVMLVAGLVIALAGTTPQDPNILGAVLAGIGFVFMFAGGMALFNLVLFKVLRQLEE